MALIFLLAALMQAPASPPPGALHLLLRSEFHYLGSVRATQNEFWFTPDSLWYKSDGKIATVPRPSFSVPPAPEDLHTAGYDYDPEFAWNVADASETRTIQGRECRLTTATGIAAYAGTELRLWFCPARSRDEAPLNSLIADTAGGPYRGIAAFVAAESGRRSGRVLLAFEETTEPAIAPLMVRKTDTVALDTSPANP